MAIPHPSYPNKSFFNEESYNTLPDAAHKPSYSCCAFARFIYRAHNGKETGTPIPAKASVRDCPTGSLLKCTHRGGTHWLIVGAHYKDPAAGDGFYIYDGNWALPVRSRSPYVVRYQKMSYAAFGKTFTIAGGLRP